MSYMSMSEAQAEELLAHLVVREPFRLQSLARRIAASGGDLEALDASVESLDVLWDWYLGYAAAGLPGVGVEERPSMWREEWLDSPVVHQRPLPREMVVGEEIDHYLRLVFARWEPPGDWVLFRTEDPERFDEIKEYEPGVMLGGVWKPALWGEALTDKLARGAIVPPYERGAITRGLRRAGMLPEGVVQERGPSVLAPYLEMDLGPEPPESKVSPMWGWVELGPAPQSAVAPDYGARPVDEGVTVWRGPWDALDELELAGVLDAGRLAVVLAEAGGTVKGEPVTAAMLTGGVGESDVEVDIGDGLAQVEVFLLDGTIRQVGAEPWSVSKAQWRSLKAALRRYAKGEKGRIVADSAMM